MADGTGTLHQLYPVKTPTEGCFVGVIVVPDFGSRANTAWSDASSGCWLRSLLPSMLDNPLVLTFEHGEPSDEFIWQYFAHRGDLLAESLIDFGRTNKVQLTSLVFFCHGLGGLIVKKAVRRMHDEFHKPEFGRLFKLLCGIVFLGCPHLKIGEAGDWHKLPILLRENMTLPKKTMQIAEETIATVTNISRAFTESNLDFPILSAFESKPTKVKGAILKRQILVSESLARARVSHEEMFQVDCTHRTLCHVSRESRLHTRLAEFLMLTQASATPAIPLTPTVAESAVAWSVSNANEDDSQFMQLGFPEHRGLVGLSPGTSKQNTWASSSDRSGYEIIPGQPITGIAKRLKLPAYMLGPHGVAPEFCGRENVLQQLWSTLCTQNGQDSRTEPSLRTFAISAAGGMGKTQIAVAFATKCKKMKIFDAIFWIQADDKCKLAQSFADISLHLGLEDSIGDQIVSRDLVLEWLSYPVHQVQEGVKYTPEESHTLRWLLIFDNADDLSNLPEYWPIGGGGSILITSRDPLANSQTYFKCDVGIQLGPFHHEDAASLIRTLTGYSSPKDHELSVTIAGRLDCFPLVVNQMAKTIKRRNLSLKEFLSYYEQTELRQSFNKEPIIAYPGSRGTPRTIATVWSLEDLPPPATSLLDVISFMDPDQIQESLLSPTAIGQSGDKRIFAQDYPTTLSSFVLARSELIGSSLLSRNTDSEELTTHRIIQDINRLQMSPDKFSFVFGAVCELLYEQWPFSEFDWEPSRWVKCEPIISHITYLSEIYKGTTNMSLTTATTERFARLVMDAGWYYIERGLYGISAPYFDLSEQLCSLAPQETIITLTDLCYCRAELCNTLSDAKSGLPYARQYLELAEKHDPKGWRRAQAHNMLSALFVDLCDFEDAIYHADLAIQLYENLPVPEYVGFAYINKAFGLLLSDRAEEAEKVLTNYLRGRPGQPQPEVGEPIKAADAQRLLGAVLRRQGRYSESLAMLKKSLNLVVGTVGGDDFRAAPFHDQIGDTQQCLKGYQDAKHSYRRAIELWPEKPEFFLELSKTYFNLSHACEEMRDTKEAAAAKEHGERILGKIRTGSKEEDLLHLMPGWGRI